MPQNDGTKRHAIVDIFLSVHVPEIGTLCLFHIRRDLIPPEPKIRIDTKRYDLLGTFLQRTRLCSKHFSPPSGFSWLLRGRLFPKSLVRSDAGFATDTHLSESGEQWRSLSCERRALCARPRSQTDRSQPCPSPRSGYLHPIPQSHKLHSLHCQTQPFSWRPLEYDQIPLPSIHRQSW